MKTINKNLFVYCMMCLLLASCEDDIEGVPQPASLKMVHAAPGAPSVHVNYFGVEDLNFSINPALAFGGNARYTIPAREARNIRFTYAADTAREVFNQELTLNPGQISTFFLLGDSANHSSVIIDDAGHRTFQDSLNAIRFINMSESVEAVNVGLADSSVVIATDLSFSNATEFIEFDATLENQTYTFTFKNDEGSVLSSYEFRQYEVFDFPGFFFVNVKALRKNVTLALVGAPDDGAGNSTLQVVQVNHF